MCRPCFALVPVQPASMFETVTARSSCDEAIQSAGHVRDCFASLAMTTRLLSSHHHHDGIFDQLLEGTNELGAERAVDGAVIAGERHAHHVRDLDLAAAHDGAL